MEISSVLITGAGGFIGSHLVNDQISLGRKVTALDTNLDRFDHLHDTLNLKLVLGDIRDSKVLADSLKGVDVVFHLASAHLEVSKPLSYFESINVYAARTLVELAAAAGVKRIVHCSTVGVYGPLAKLPADEDTACRPEIDYEITKLKGEMAVREAAMRENISTVILRPAWVYGPGCPRTLKLFRAIRKKKFAMVGDGQNFRHPIYIDDMMMAFEKAASKPESNVEIYIVAAGKAVHLDELINEIISVLDLDFRPKRIPLALMTPVCIVVEGICKILKIEPPFSTRSLKFFTESSAFDTSKVKVDLDFQPKVSLAVGLRETHKSFVRAGLLQ